LARIPGLIKPKWYDREWLVELTAGIVPAATLVWAAIDSFKSNQPKKGWTFLAALLVLLMAAGIKVLRGRVRDQKRIQQESPMDLLGCAHVLHRALTHQLGGHGDIRVTIHRVVPGGTADDEKYEQVIPYVGGQGGGSGRQWSTKVGIVGRVVRKGAPLSATRATSDHGKVIDELIQVWGYGRQEAQALAPDREAWMAVPIYDAPTSRAVIGVVYIDSAKASLDNEDTSKIVVEMCKGIAHFIRTRYN